MISKKQIQKKQERELWNILRELKQTHRKRDLLGSNDLVRDYKTFADEWPISSYRDYQPYINRIKKGESDVLWPGRTNLFAVSAGTTGKGKHLPIYSERLTSDYRYLRRVVKKAIGMIGFWPFLTGNRLSLPGGITFQDGLILGEISGILALFSPKMAGWKQLCSPSDLAKMSWKEKYEMVFKYGSAHSVSAFTGVPTWIPQLLDDIADEAGKSIEAHWSDCKICITGGASFGNYETLLRSRFPDKTRFLECYGASEGYYAIQAGEEPGELQLVIDNGLFFELIPESDLRSDSENESFSAIPLWEAEIGRHYELVVTNNSGLVRYRSGDFVRMTACDKLFIEGRVHDVLDIAGERVQLGEVKEILEKHTTYDHILITTLVGTASSKLMVAVAGGDSSEVALNEFDTALQQKNRHYQIRRETQSFDHPVIVVSSRSDLMEAAMRIKQQSQVKLPSVINNPELGKRWYKELTGNN